MTNKPQAEKWGGAPDEEVADLMHKLSHLQTWCVLMGRHDSGGAPAAQLIQDTRALIVERLYPRAMEARSGAVITDDRGARA